MLPINGEWKDQTLTFKVYDKDLLFDDLLGAVQLPLAGVLQNCVAVKLELDLGKPKDELHHGKLIITVDGYNCGAEPLPEVLHQADMAPAEAEEPIAEAESDDEGDA